MKRKPTKKITKKTVKKIVKVDGNAPLLEQKTKEITKIITDSLKVGSHLETAAATAGITRDTLRRWLYRGEQILQQKEIAQCDRQEKIYVTFLLAVRKAIAQCELNDLKRIEQASKIDWKASAWRLSHRHQRRWGQTKTVDHKLSGQASIDHKHSVEVDVDSLPIDVCEKLLSHVRQKDKRIIDILPEKSTDENDTRTDE